MVDNTYLVSDLTELGRRTIFIDFGVVAVEIAVIIYKE